MGLMQVQVQVQLLLNLLASGTFTLIAAQGGYLLLGRGNFKREVVAPAVVEPLLRDNLISIARDEHGAEDIFLPTAEGLRAVRNLNAHTD